MQVEATLVAAPLSTVADLNSKYFSPATLSKEHVRYGFVPNDPYFNRDTPYAGANGQWYLQNQYNPGMDINVMGAWARGLTGLGVLVAIVDDSFQTNHPDLSPNFDILNSYNFGRLADPAQSTLPDPVYADDQHGVSVAGLIAGRGGNGIGITGVAPYAGLAGIRVDFNLQTDEMFAMATLYHSSGDNTSIKIKNHSYGMSETYVPLPLEYAALQESAGAGTIHIWSAGNDRGTRGQDTNKKDLASRKEAIAVAALSSEGTFSSYSNFGANVFVTAPSNSSSGFYGVTTTDRTGEAYGYNGSNDSFPDSDYTSLFGGTSASAPIVSGVIALGKQVQPNMDVRMAKHLLARSSDIVDAADASFESDGGWKVNGAGLSFNQNYGFGRINAERFTQLASQYSGVTAQTSASTGLVNLGSAALPDGTGWGLRVQVQMLDTTPLEEVLVYINATHTYRGDLEAYVTSPSGMTSRLFVRSGSDSQSDIDWTFSTNAFWGESPYGNWSLDLYDVWEGDVGTWNSFDMMFDMGELIPEPCALLLLSLALPVIIRRRRRVAA